MGTAFVETDLAGFSGLSRTMNATRVMGAIRARWATLADLVLDLDGLAVALTTGAQIRGAQ